MIMQKILKLMFINVNCFTHCCSFKMLLIVIYCFLFFIFIFFSHCYSLLSSYSIFLDKQYYSSLFNTTHHLTSPLIIMYYLSLSHIIAHLNISVLGWFNLKPIKLTKFIGEYISIEYIKQ